MGFEQEFMEYVKQKEQICRENDSISDELFSQYGVYRGLRDLDGKGVVTGLTTISKIVSFKTEDGRRVPCDGELWYRGYQVKSLIQQYGDKGFGFERTAYLLLFGVLPTDQEMKEESAHQFYQRCHYESPLQGYHEYNDQEHPHAGFLRPQCRYE